MGRILAVLGILMVLLTGCSPGEDPVRPGLIQGIDAVFEDMNSPDSPGGTVAVIREGKMLYSKGYGSAQLEYGIPNTPNTVFHVASVSKQFTAMAVALLVAEGALSLDDPVQKHLDYVPDLGRPVTLRQLVHHTSGIRDQWELLGVAGWRLDDVITTDHIVGLMSRQRELNFEPNSEFLYSNTGYTLLGETVNAVSGMSLRGFTEKRIFAPLGMTRTHFHDDHQHAVEGRAYSYEPAEGGGFQKSVLTYANVGATSLFTTAVDLARWLDNFRHEGVGGPEVMAAMKTRGTLNNGETIEYAHGVSIRDYRGHTTIGHDGGDAGFRTFVIWFPEVNTGIVVLTNVSNGNATGRALQVADVVLADVLDAHEDDETDVPVTVETNAEALKRIPGRFLLIGKQTPTGRGLYATIEESEGDLQLHFPQTETFSLAATGERSFHPVGLRLGDGRAILEFDADWDSVTVTGLDGTVVGSGTRLDDFDPSPSELVELEGTYYSPEVETLYRVEVAGAELAVQHVRHGKMSLTPLVPDEFTSDGWFVRFERNASGDVTGLRVSSERVRNLRFVRLTTPLPD